MKDGQKLLCIDDSNQKVLKVGEKEYNLERCFDENGSVKSSDCLKIICNRAGNVYNIQEELKRYFSNKKLPIDTQKVFGGGY